MELTVTINVEERLREELKEINMEEKEIQRFLDEFSEWLQLDPGAIAEAAEHYLEDLSRELVSDFVDEIKEILY
ncbi:Uncharacterised protein [Mycobacterium tuberculosis]|nr:Uncharacterised protein [Mycobacterium tuberculosis]